METRWNCHFQKGRGHNLLLRRFLDDSRGVLGEVLELAFVRIELLLDLGRRFSLTALPWLVDGELRIAELAHSEHRDILATLDDPEFSLCHAPSLRCWRSCSSPCGNQTAPLPADGFRAHQIVNSSDFSCPASEKLVLRPQAASG